MSYDQVGDVQVAQGDLAGALKSYRDSFAIRERLAQSDPGNAGWQRDLSVSYCKLGDVSSKQGNIEEAVKNYRLALTLVDRLVAIDGTNRLWQADLVEYNYDLAMIGDDAVRKFALVVQKLAQFQAKHALNKEQAQWLKNAEAALAKLSQQ